MSRVHKTNILLNILFLLNPSIQSNPPHKCNVLLWKCHCTSLHYIRYTSYLRFSVGSVNKKVQEELGV